MRSRRQYSGTLSKVFFPIFTVLAYIAHAWSPLDHLKLRKLKTGDPSLADTEEPLSPSSAMTGSRPYPRSIVLLHWLVFLAAALTVAAIEIKGFYPKGTSERALLNMLHESFGILVLALMTLRLMVRSTRKISPAPAGSAWISISAHLMHAALYILMLSMPVLGLLALGWSGKPLMLFGTTWILPMSLDMPLGRSIKQLHEAGSNLVFIAVGLHAAAALWHQLILKDGLMQRMRLER